MFFARGTPPHAKTHTLAARGAVAQGSGPVIGLGILDRLGAAGRLGGGIYDMPVTPFAEAVEALQA